MFTSAMVVNILQYVSVSNKYVVHLKLYTTFLKKWLAKKKKNGWLKVMQCTIQA